MKKIIVLDEEAESSLSEMIIKVCKKNGGALVIDIESDKIYQTSENPDFLIIISQNCGKIELSGGTAVFGNGYSGGDCRFKNMISVVDTSNIHALETIRKIGGIAVGCSLSAHDTITVSGITENGIYQISLMRSISGLDGEITEPHDLTVKAEKDSEIYPILASCAVLILNGIENNGESVIDLTG